MSNRTHSKAAAWVRHHRHRSANRPADAADRARLVMPSVGNDDDVRAVVYGDAGVLACWRARRPGRSSSTTTTTSAVLARELSAGCAQRDVGFVDAPLSGGQAGAEAG